MHDPQAFESRLTAALQRYTAEDPTLVDAAALARTIVADARARHSGGIRARLGMRWAPHFVRVVVALLLLATLAGGAVLVGSRLLTPSPAPLIPADRGVFTPTGSMAVGRGSLSAATLLRDGRVAVIGGYGGRMNAPGSYLEGTDALSSIEVWDPQSGAFTPVGSLLVAREGHVAVLLRDGRVLVVGGYGSDGSDGRSAEIWDPVTLGSTRTGSLSVGRSEATALLLPDGRVLIAGGDIGEDAALTAEVWDPATGLFGAADSIPEASYPSGTILDDGGVLVFVRDSQILPNGGPDDVGSAERWDPVTGTSSPAGSLVVPRSGGFTATLLADGRVLIAGGVQYRCALCRTIDAAEIWDPATMAFEATGSLSVPRNTHSATLLGDGRVLVVGASLGGAADTAEVFELR